MDVSLESPMLPIFRSAAMAAILAVLYERPSTRRTVAGLARATGVPQPSVSRTVDLLVAAGLATTAVEGRNRFVTADWSRPWADPLAALVAVTAGVPRRIAEALTDLPGVAEAHLYGSWVARQDGQDGPPPNDIDLLIVGSADFTTVRSALQPVERAIHRPINPIIVDRDRWLEPADDPFLLTVQDRPSLTLDIGRTNPVGHSASPLAPGSAVHERDR